MLISFLLTYRFSDYYIICATGGQDDGQLPFWLPGLIKHIVVIACFVCRCWNKYTTTTTTRKI